MSDLQMCEECGHVRYDHNRFDGRCDTCEMWAERELAALTAKLEALRVALEGFKAASLYERERAEDSLWSAADSAFGKGNW